MRGGGGAQTPGTGLRRGAEGVTSLYRAYRGKGEPPDYTQAEVIVLDDLGKVRPSEHSYQTLMTLIEHVISEGKALIVTSNYSPSQAARRCALEDPQAAFPLASRLALAGENHRGGRVRPPGGTPPAGGVCWAKELGEELRRRPAGCPLGRGKASPPRRKVGGLLAPRSGLRATEGGQDLPPSRDSRRDLPK